MHVEQIHRHHKRTPYTDNSFPTEPYQWNCDDQALCFSGQPFEGHDAAHGYRKGYISGVNPFVQSGWTGSCQFPQITPGGLEDSWQHGADLFGVYHDLLGFLPDELSSSKVRYRATNNVITHQVAGMVINGMWKTTDNVPLYVQVCDDMNKLSFLLSETLLTAPHYYRQRRSTALSPSTAALRQRISLMLSSRVAMPHGDST